jgi:hypothetical protein
LTPQLIVYRMATGTAWTSTTRTQQLHDTELTVNGGAISRINTTFHPSVSEVRSRTVASAADDKDGISLDDLGLSKDFTKSDKIGTGSFVVS